VNHNVHFAAAIGGQSDTLETIASCFRGDNLRFRKIANEWFVESPDFDSCKNSKDALTVAELLLLRIHQILALYCRLHAPFSLNAVVQITDDGRVLPRRGLRATAGVEVYSSAGVQQLSSDVEGVPLANRLIDAVRQNDLLRQVFNLRGDQPLTWERIYDLLERIGGVDYIVSTGLASRAETRRIRRTANHYRHLGNPKGFTLPADPPTLREATAFITNLAIAWVGREL
jgi:hypothetical protein